MTQNLTTDEGILEHLNSLVPTATTAAAFVSVARLSGGNANFVWRVTLGEDAAPAVEAALSVQAGTKTIVAKHAESYAALSPTFALEPERMHFEVQAMNIASSLTMPSESPACAVCPRVLLFDKASNVLLLEDAGAESSNLKQFISDLKTPPSAAMLEHMGSGLGTFVARLHNHGRKHRADSGPLGDALCKMENPYALDLSRLILYDKVPMVVASNGMTGPEADQVLEAAAASGKLLMEGGSHPDATLAMGDLWPGNMLVPSASSEHPSLMIVDWELARLGPAAMDLGQFLAEAYCLDVFRHPSLPLLRSFQLAYLATIDKTWTLDDLRIAAVHMGSHLMVWSPKTGWTTDPKAARDIADTGAAFIRAAWNQDWPFLQSTPLKPFVDAALGI